MTLQPIPALINAKISMPAQCVRIVSRPRLEEKLIAGLLRPLSVICAPAGFGKTTLVSNTLRAQADKYRIAWLSLEAEDSHLIRFLYHLVTTLQSVAPDVGLTSIFLMGRLQLPATNDLMSALIGELTNAEAPIVLVLDDYHVISSPEIQAALTFLIEHMPERLRLVLISRYVPDLPLARWRLQQRLCEVDLDDLRFSHEESSRFLEQTMGLSLNDHLVLTLDRKTEGWIAGLQMAALSLKNSCDSESLENFAHRVGSFSGQHRHVLEYLAGRFLASSPLRCRIFCCIPLRSTVFVRGCVMPLQEAATAALC